MPPTRDEIKVVAQEIAEHYFGLMKEYIDREIMLHAAQCAAGKWGWFKSFMSAVAGGIIVGLVLWIIKKG